MDKYIEIILAHVKFNEKAELNDDDTLPIEDVLEVLNTDYPDFVYTEPDGKRMKWTNNGKIFFQPYLQAKIDDKNTNVDIVIKIRRELSESIKTIVTISKTTGKEIKYQRYPQPGKERSNNENSVYFIPPRHWKKNEFNGTYQDISTGHYVTEGEETIKIIFTDSHEEFMTLCSTIRDEEKDFYKKLVYDLVSIQQQLCIDNSSTMSIAIKRSDYLYEEIKNMIDRFYDTFWILERNAQSELKYFKDKKIFSQVKKISSQTLMEHEILHKNKVTAISYREDFDTFEHRVIKTHLKYLKNMLTVQQKITYIKLENKRLQLELEQKKNSREEQNDNAEEKQLFHDEKSDRGKLLGELKKNMKQEIKKWEKLENKLNKIYESPLIKNTTDNMTSIRISNLFAYNSLYQEMYDVILQNNKKIAGIDYHVCDNDDAVSIAKLPKLYEIWCCLKLVLIFHKKYGLDFVSIKSKDETTGIDGLKEYIHDVLNNNNNDMKETMFELSGKIKDKEIGDININVKIWYNQKINIDTNILRKENISVKIPYLIPDIVMKICVNGKEKLFILDAKYRINKYYDGIQDLCEVAFQKYTLKLGHGMDRIKEFGFTDSTDSQENIDGSFIIHSNSETNITYDIIYDYKTNNVKINPKKYLGAYSDKLVEKWNEDKVNNIKIKYSPKKYLGAYPDKLVKLVEEWSEKKENKWTDKNKKDKWQVLIKQFKEWAKWSTEKRETGIHENRIGIITVNPKEEDNLMYLLQMIMEQHFEIYQSKCWLCGSDNIDVQPKPIKNNYKYYIKCQKCKKLTVETHCGIEGCPSHKANLKLGKHSENYLNNVNEKACWKVICPKCRNLNPNSEAKWEYIFRMASQYNKRH